MTAGIATLKLLTETGIWSQLEERAAQLAAGLRDAAQRAGVPIQQTRAGTMFTNFFTERLPLDWPSVKTCDVQSYARFFRGMLERGVYLAPSQFEAGFLSSAHRQSEIERTVQAASEVFKAL